jgi:hypothetical protein
LLDGIEDVFRAAEERRGNADQNARRVVHREVVAMTGKALTMPTHLIQIDLDITSF